MANEQEKQPNSVPEAIQPTQGELSEKELEKASGGATLSTVPAVQSVAPGASSTEKWIELNSFQFGASNNAGE